jgi:hypothetical protein
MAQRWLAHWRNRNLNRMLLLKKNTLPDGSGNMNFDVKDLKIAVVSDGPAFGATRAPGIVGVPEQYDLVSGNLTVAACAGLRVGICQADQLGHPSRA